MSRGKKIGIVVVAVLVILVLVLAIAIFLIPTIKITGTNLQINYTGTTTGYLGPSSQALPGAVSVRGGSQFSYTLTLSSGAFVFSHSINSISISTPGFSLVSASPSLPYTLTPSSSVIITLTIQATSSSYSGPLGIVVSTS